MDEATFCGCLVQARILGVIEAKQSEPNRKTRRNDRLVTVAAKSHHYGALKTIKDLDAKLVDEIEHFFVSYNTARGKRFKPIGRFGPARAHKLVEKTRAENSRPTAFSLRSLNFRKSAPLRQN